MKKGFFRAGFRLKDTILAHVERVKDDRVLFYVLNQDGETCIAWYYVHGEHINLHQIFKKGDCVEVKVISIVKDNKKSLLTEIIVMPVTLPVDTFVAENPIGSDVIGTVTEINGGNMLIELAKNVFCLVKRVANSKTGMEVTCRLDRYNQNKKMLFAAIV